MFLNSQARAKKIVAPVGRNNWSIDFPGTGGSAGVAGPYLNNANLIPVTDFTVLMWVYPRTVLRRGLCRWGGNVNSEGAVFRLGSNVAGATNDLQMQNPDSGPQIRSNTQPIVANEWCSVAVSLGTTYQDASSALYHNGSPLATTTQSGTPVTTTNGLSIGHGTDIADAPVYTHPFDGYIACFMAWSPMLTAAEVLEVHNGGAGFDPRVNTGNYTSAADLIRSYVIEEGTGTFTDDEAEAPATANRMVFTGNGTLTWYDQTGGAGAPP